MHPRLHAIFGLFLILGCQESSFLPGIGTENKESESQSLGNGSLDQADIDQDVTASVPVPITGSYLSSNMIRTVDAGVNSEAELKVTLNLQADAEPGFLEGLEWSIEPSATQNANLELTPDPDDLASRRILASQGTLDQLIQALNGMTIRIANGDVELIKQQTPIIWRHYRFFVDSISGVRTSSVYEIRFIVDGVVRENSMISNTEGLIAGMEGQLSASYGDDLEKPPWQAFDNILDDSGWYVQDSDFDGQPPFDSLRSVWIGVDFGSQGLLVDGVVFRCSNDLNFSCDAVHMEYSSDGVTWLEIPGSRLSNIDATSEYTMTFANEAP
ncbi:hypothetical protein [Pseudobacteriovorax antillogorgiicola]|uniref:F5/8 type C domain-containing protein n=1 Tax=Pseudobacteriovorax antillogorgiicola TaxID=1513793 RepID=A0A1Y6CLX7_9BACT|nr:hypothetical protein [Pseudobacteriovorax antillogorgiicola]TCS47304.1 hypothetical protein EDD56_12179 [Pseudobacteriovorax antillogorgiicola]SMF62591.1 hypothetical protein SAMN06296036_12179 [Pseudobacteriovorax antillogorgiicola]